MENCAQYCTWSSELWESSPLRSSCLPSWSENATFAFFFKRQKSVSTLVQAFYNSWCLKKKKKEQHGKFSEYLGKGKGNLCLLLILGGKGGYLWKNYKDMQNYQRSSLGI